MRKLRTIEMHRLTVEEFKEAQKLPLIVVLDDVRSLYNVGAVFRSADAFRVKAVYLCGITATPPNAEIHKTALGGEDSVDWRYFARTEDAVDELHRQGAFVYSVEQVEGSTKLQELSTSLTPLPPSPSGRRKSPTERTDAHPGDATPLPEGEGPGVRLEGPGVRLLYAVIFGNEVKGVKQSVVDMSDGCLEIPQFGTKHSLNVSTTAGIVIWEFAKGLMLG